MTETELKQTLNMTLSNYNKDFDENIATLWTGFFINFNAKMFSAACLKIIADNKYFPNVSEMIDAYQYVENEIKRERREKLIASRKMLTDKQEFCYICGNGGWCIYLKDGYEYAARCICGHGKDLNKFSEAQINLDYKAEVKDRYTAREKSAIRSGKNPFYIPTVQEAMGKDFALFDAKKKDQYLRQLGKTDEEKLQMLKEINDMLKSIKK